MIPLPFILKILKVSVLIGVGSVGIYTINSIHQKEVNRSNQTPVRCCNSENLLDQQLKDAAQKALDAIGSKLKLTASNKGPNHSQHVFNNGLLKFHSRVLEDLLKDLGHYDEQMKNLEQYLYIPLSPTEQNAISTMVAHFSQDEFYVDYNAALYGEYVRQLRQALVEYLKAYTSDNGDNRRGIHEIRQQVRNIGREMANHDVYVDPMARDRWLQENRDHVQVYYRVRDKLRNMFQNILDNFESVSGWIRGLRARNWKRDDIK